MQDNGSDENKSERLDTAGDELADLEAEINSVRGNYDVGLLRSADLKVAQVSGDEKEHPGTNSKIQGGRYMAAVLYPVACAFVCHLAGWNPLIGVLVGLGVGVLGIIRGK